MRLFIRKVACLIAVLCLTISLAGCGPKPEDSVKGFFNALSKQDVKAAATFIENNDNSKIITNNADEEKIANQIFSKIKYEIVSSSVSGDTAKVKTKITSPDLVKITSKMVTDLLPTLFASALSGKTDESKNNQLVDDYYIKSLSAQDAPMTTSEIDISLVMNKDKKTWLIKGNDDLSNAITGNLAKAFDSLSNQASSESNTDQSHANPNQPQNPAPDSKLHSIGEQATYGRASITVEKVEKSTGSEYDKPQNGMEFVIVSIKEKNVGTDKNIEYNPVYFKMQNSKGQITGTTFTTINQDTALQSGELTPNGEVHGTLVFEEPKDDSNLIFMFADNDPLLKFQIK